MTVDTPCSTPEASQFDFWLGEWELTWAAEQMGGEPGESGHGTNRVQRLFGMCAVEENFSTTDGEFLGRSISAYSPRLDVWRQTWVDNQGSYLTFTGSSNGEQMVLRTEPYELDGERLVNRMVFHDIRRDSFNWDWQRSSDNGDSWTDVWNISYKRISG